MGIIFLAKVGREYKDVLILLRKIPRESLYSILSTLYPSTGSDKLDSKKKIYANFFPRKFPIFIKYLLPQRKQ